ncbi:MAG: hypothetical protein ABSC94_30385 [Polyangiaceae bacterium]
MKRFAGAPGVGVDDLGVVSVDCVAADTTCERQLFDAVCARGGDVAWGLGDNPLTATHLLAHAAHSKRTLEGPRGRGCAVATFVDTAPSMPTENIGPVVAYCAVDDSKDACLRELQDQVCRLGGDALWQVEGPVVHDGRLRMRGRAAHSR